MIKTQKTKNLSIIGSTGSIGEQARKVAKHLGIEIVAISAAGNNLNKMEQQIRENNIRRVGVVDKSRAEELRTRIKDAKTEVFDGEDASLKTCLAEDIDTVIVSTVGISALIPIIEALKSGKKVLTANKEALVTGGNIVMPLARKAEAEGHGGLIPIDSEHNAVHQCLRAGKHSEIKKITLTCSGGPFFGKSKEYLENVSIEKALEHPTWVMGKKITVDCATLVNKGLEVIEAKWLFDLPVSKIEVVVHPESVVHSYVEFVDNSMIIQMGVTSMELPIQYALTYPDRLESEVPELDLVSISAKKGGIHFYKPDLETFIGLRLAYEAAEIGGTATTILNSSDECAVKLALDHKIRFWDIPYLLENALIAGQKENKIIQNPTLKQILEVDAWARDYVDRSIKLLR